MNPWAALNFSDGWSVYGIRTTVDGAEQCVVIASTEVSTVEMNQTVSKRSFEEGTFMETGWRNSTITQRFKGDMAMGIGDTYAEAMVDLFGKWNPDEGQQPEITMGV